jgi:DNA-binding transcriptional LysR family regulator
MDELRALRYVVAVAEDLSFSGAAKRLGVAQPTLSRAVRTFEDEHGIVLFDRSTRSVALTHAGRALVDRAASAIEQADQAITAARRVAAGVEGRVRLGFVTGAANALLPDIARELRLHRPGIELDLQHLSVDDQITALHQRRLDVGLLRLPSNATTSRRLVIDTLIPDHLVAAVPATSPLARGDQPLPWTALRDQSFVFWPRAMAPSLHDQILQHLHTAGAFTPRIVLETRDTLALLALVAADIGVTLVTAGTARALRRAGVIYRDLADPPHATIAVAHRPDASPATRALLDACRALLPNA